MPLLPTAAKDTHSDVPDYTITDFHAIDLDQAGHLRYELAAEKLVHFAVPDHAVLAAPDMVFYRNDSPGAATTAAPWQLTAASGGNRLAGRHCFGESPCFQVPAQSWPTLRSKRWKRS